MKNHKDTTNMMRITVGSPEGGTTIEQVEGATLETSHELARMLMRAASTSTGYAPPSYEEVQRIMDETQVVQ